MSLALLDRPWRLFQKQDDRCCVSDDHACDGREPGRALFRRINSASENRGNGLQASFEAGWRGTIGF
jgi:hypothetical protein